MRGALPERPLAGDDLLQLVDVSRETVERLAQLVALVEQWQPTINLVGPSTLGDVWRRHVLDSAQLWAHWPPEARLLVDLGSGAGFPGLSAFRASALLVEVKPGSGANQRNESQNDFRR